MTSEERKELVYAVTDLAAKLAKLSSKELEGLAEYVRDNGTDHEDGRSVDELTESIFELASDMQSF